MRLDMAVSAMTATPLDIHAAFFSQFATHLQQLEQVG
jgi:hypothetical protein